MKILFLVLFLVSCSHGSHEESTPLDDERLTVLADKFKSKKEGVTALLDPQTGWVNNHDCDGTLWAGKAAAIGLPVQLDLAEYAPGELHRRPAPSCWNEKDGDVGSKSTISNDMILGWLWAKWNLKDFEAIKRLAQYGEDHNWVMGKPASMVSRVLLKPNQQGLLGRMIFEMSQGTDSRSYRHLFEYYAEVKEDYEMHLQALGILLQGEVSMDQLDPNLLDINDQMIQRLHDLVDANPENPLFQAALGVYTGDFDQAITLLLEDTTPVPTYVRGGNVEVLAKVEWLFAANIVIRAFHSED